MADTCGTENFGQALSVMERNLGITFEKYTVDVDYRRTLDEMISSCNFDMVNDLVRLHFAHDPRSIVEAKRQIVLFFFARPIRAEQVVSEMNSVGYVPANLPQVLSLAREFPGVQLDFPVVPLRKVWREPCIPTGFQLRIPILDRIGHTQGRQLNLAFWDIVLVGTRFRFAGVPKAA